MKRIILTAACLIGANPAIASEISLEGITILGKNRSAHLSVDGSKVTARAGEKVAEWTLHKIEPRVVHLQAPDGEIVQMALHTRLSEVPPKPESKPTPPASDPKTEEKAKFTPRRIADEDIPPGKRRVRTPFGDVLVDDEKAAK